MVVFQFDIIYDSSSLRGRGDPVAIRRHDGPAVEPVARTRSSIARRRSPRRPQKWDVDYQRASAASTCFARSVALAQKQCWAFVLARCALFSNKLLLRKTNLSSNVASRAEQAASRLLFRVLRAAALLLVPYNASSARS